MNDKFKSKEDLQAYLKNKYPNDPEKWKERYCSFCGAGSYSAKGVVAGPNNVLICSECVVLAHDLLKKSGQL